MADNNKCWSKIYDMRDWEWWSKPKMVKMFLFLITNVTYRRELLPSGNIISRGEMETNLSELMEILDMTIKEVRISIERMKRTDNIQTRVAHNHLIITVVNYDKYQGKATKSQSNTATLNGNINTERAGLGHGFIDKKGRVKTSRLKDKKSSKKYDKQRLSELSENDKYSNENDKKGRVYIQKRAGFEDSETNRGRVSAKIGQGLNSNSETCRNTDKQRDSDIFENGKNAPKNDKKGRVSAKIGQGWGRVDTAPLYGCNADKHVDTEECSDSENSNLGQGLGQKTGEKHPHIEYNRIIEGINKYINTSKIFSKSLDSTEKSEIVSSILKSIGIEEIQKKENETNSPEEISQEENVQSQVDEALTPKEKKPTKKRPPKENVTLISKCRRIFEPYYKRHIGEEYYWEAKDGGGMKYLIQKIKKARSDRGQPTDDENIIMAWSALLDSISDQWMLEHLSIVNINSKYNEIVASAKRDKSNGTGGKEKSVKSAEDKYERKQRVIAERQRKLMASTDADDAMFAIFRSKKDAGEIPESVSIDEWLRSTMAEESIS